MREQRLPAAAASDPQAAQPTAPRTHAAEEGLRRGLLPLALLSLLVGAASGLVGAGFRLMLEQADRWRGHFLDWAHRWEPTGLPLPILLFGATAAAAAWMARRFSPFASGSGIPHVEAALHRELPQAPLRLIPVKFIGGVLAIGGGLALGREGPTVQMGATLAHGLGRAFRRNEADCLALLAAGAGAGLATAFNAPIAGAVFVLEELVRRFGVRSSIATFGASAGAIAVSRLFLGQAPDFEAAPLPPVGIGAIPMFLVLGVLAGFLGVAYNFSLLSALAAADRLRWLPVEARAGAVGAGVGALAWFAPNLVGGGEALAQKMLSGEHALHTLGALFLIRFVLGPVSYAAQTPGGLFAPMLVLGAQCGVMAGLLAARCAPTLAPEPCAFALVGMAAFFTAVVRAPLTGMILAAELTGCYTLFLPMLAASFAAMLAPTLLGAPPIYDSLRERLPRPGRPARAPHLGPTHPEI